MGAWQAFCGFGFAASTYYISPSGDDRMSGLSVSTPWQSVSKVNSVSFQPGDRILFEGGQLFQGPVKLDSRDGGAPNHAIQVGAYRVAGHKLATILAKNGAGIEVHGTSGLRISNLTIRGDGPMINKQSGIILFGSKTKGASHVVIDRVEISGFGEHGISIIASEASCGYRNVLISHCTIHDNNLNGILTEGPWGHDIYAHQDIRVKDCNVFNMFGGSGITLSSVNGGIVERCVAYNNGANFSGAVGIWAWDSNNILFQFNESYGNRTKGVDGDGFDFDGGVTNSVMQFNYSHDNDAAGFLLAQYDLAPQAMKNITIRFNISKNDARKRKYGAIHVWNGDASSRISKVHIYRNTIFQDIPLDNPTTGSLSKVEGSGDASEAATSPSNEGSAIRIVSSNTSAAVHNNTLLTIGAGMQWNGAWFSWVFRKLYPPGLLPSAEESMR